MNIIVFSDNKTLIKSFSEIKKSKDMSITIHPAGDIKKFMKKTPVNVFLYIDINSYPSSEHSKILKLFNNPETFSYGIIDTTGKFDDPAAVFFTGASDYIGKNLLKKGITGKRLNDASAFRKLNISDSPSSADSAQYILSGNSWSGIKTGNEYTFCMMFIELDNKKELRTSYSGENLNVLLSIFQKHIEDVVIPQNGKMWMWQDYGGLILFPFNGKTCEAILTSVRLILNRNIISAEYFKNDILLSYRIAIHLGTTVYKKRGETGKIISDSINSIFHLGQKFADPDSLNLTESLVPYIPKGLEKLFIPAGEYEGRNILRMRRPIY